MARVPRRERVESRVLNQSKRVPPSSTERNRVEFSSRERQHRIRLEYPTARPDGHVRETVYGAARSRRGQGHSLSDGNRSYPGSQRANEVSRKSVDILTVENALDRSGDCRIFVIVA